MWKHSIQISFVNANSKQDLLCRFDLSNLECEPSAAEKIAVDTINAMRQGFPTATSAGFVISSIFRGKQVFVSDDAARLSYA